MKKGLVFLIKIYRKYLSTHMLHNCRFYPSCSEYALECLRLHSFFCSLFYITTRILRCSPLSQGGYDPAPLSRRRI